jgi:hypothetical protein
MPLNLTAVLCAVALLLGLGGGYKLRDYQAAAAELKAQTAIAAAKEEADAKMAAVAAEYEEFRTAALEQRGKDTQTIREIYRDVEVSPDCAPLPAAVGVLNAAIDRANAEAGGQSSGAVPKDTSPP